jgi:hypothetical protein
MIVRQRSPHAHVDDQRDHETHRNNRHHRQRFRHRLFINSPVQSRRVSVFQMWLAKSNCPKHGLTSGSDPVHVKGVLKSSPYVEEGVMADEVLETVLTTDEDCAGCKQCLAKKLTVLDAEMFGLRSFPPIPKRCVLRIPRRDVDEETLEALDVAISKDQLALMSKNYVTRPPFSRGRLHFERLRDIPSNGLYSDAVGTTEALEGLGRRLRACGLDSEKLLEADLMTFPLVFWHVSQVTQRCEEECMVLATRLMLELGRMSGKDSCLPPFGDMPLQVLEAMEGFHAEIMDTEKRRMNKLEELVVRNASDRESCARTLKLRHAVEVFNRDSFSAWGEAKTRGCCAFNFFNTNGCATCMQAFATGIELDEVKRNTPDWVVLEKRLLSLEEEMWRNIFEV